MSARKKPFPKRFLSPGRPLAEVLDDFPCSPDCGCREDVGNRAVAIPMRMAELEDTINRLKEKMRLLENRLDPVLQYPPPAEAKLREAVGGDGKLFCRLQVAGEDLREVESQVDDLLCRLEV